MEQPPFKPGTPAALKLRRHWWRWLLIGLAAMAVGGWGARFWLGERLAGALRAELAARGFHVSWQSAVFLPGQGISFTLKRKMGVVIGRRLWTAAWAWRGWG